MAADPSTRLKLLPSEPLPTGCPKPTLAETEQLEIFGLADQRAVIIVGKNKEGQATTRLRGLWLSSQDHVFARELLADIRRRHTFPGRKTVLNVSGAQTAVLTELEAQGILFTAQIMTKRVDSHTEAPLPEGVTYKNMDEGELQDFLTQVEKALADQEMTNEGGAIPRETAEARAHDAMSNLLPQRGSTSGHTFVIIGEGSETPVNVGYLWTYMNKEKQRSFCYDIEIVESMRGRGLGRKAVAVWEHIANGQQAATLGLNVFGQNTIAFKLYRGTGFVVESAVFMLDHGDHDGEIELIAPDIQASYPEEQNDIK